VRCGRCWNRHCWSNCSWDVMQRNIEWWADQVFRYHCVCPCYSRRIKTRRLQWSHCHCCWACRTLSFAMVRPFGVAIGVAKRKVIQNN
jgi:hypothetical protein